MKKLWPFLFLTMMIIFIIKMIQMNQQIVEYKNMFSSAQQETVRAIKNTYVSSLFQQTMDQPTKQNFENLGWAMNMKKSQIETLIELNKPKINETTWEEYKSLPIEQTVSYINSLSEKKEIGREDLGKLKMIKDKWGILENNLMIDTSVIEVTNPTSLTYTYNTFIKELARL